ncbi:MAG: hypothetical protein ACI8Z1_001395 [Candidatus Azotimanducaceae bacterium]|jgi:hypothetical protein
MRVRVRTIHPDSGAALIVMSSLNLCGDPSQAHRPYSQQYTQSFFPRSTGHHRFRVEHMRHRLTIPGRLILHTREALITVYLRRAAQTITAFGPHRNRCPPVGTPQGLSWIGRPQTDIHLIRASLDIDLTSSDKFGVPLCQTRISRIRTPPAGAGKIIERFIDSGSFAIVGNGSLACCIPGI